LCGYYRNATVFSNVIRHPDRLKVDGSKLYCRVKVDPKDAFLVPVDKRHDRLNPQPISSSQVMYGDTNPTWVTWFENLVGQKEHSSENEKKRRKWTNKVERNTKARKMALKKYGHTCECCKISHEDPICSAVFEVHHKVPYAEDFEERSLEITDLAVLCANCHRMIHRMPDLGDIMALRTYQKVKQSTPSEP
jgi:5-methylcytosine-specific restriction protein A